MKYCGIIFLYTLNMYRYLTLPAKAPSDWFKKS